MKDAISKGQTILKAIYGVINSPKKRTLGEFYVHKSTLSTLSTVLVASGHNKKAPDFQIRVWQSQLMANRGQVWVCIRNRLFTSGHFNSLREAYRA